MKNKFAVDCRVTSLLAKKRRRKRQGLEGRAAQTALNIYLWLTVALAIFPVLMTLLFSFKSVTDFDRGVWAFPEKLMLSNYSYGFVSIMKNMLNSICVCLITTVASIGISAFVAYVFTHKEFYGKNVLFSLIIALMMVPGVLALTPRYLLIFDLGINNSWFALILPWVSGNQVGSIFLFRTFMGQQPKDLYESAKIDGGGDFVLFFYFAVPLAVPILIIQAIGLFSSAYNDYLWSMLVIDNESIQMLMPLLKALIQDAVRNTGNPGISYAMYLISGIPLIISSAIGLRFFINGDFASGLKL